MKTSDAGRKFIEDFEGCFLAAYNDGVGVCTIGFGHTDAAGTPSVHYGMTITRAQADEILARDLEKVEVEVARLVKVPVNQNQIDALVSFQFNTGGLSRSSALKLLNAGKYSEVPAALMLWNRGGGKVMAGLTRRRKAEGDLWNKPVSAQLPDRSPAPFPPPPDIPRPEPQHQGASLVASIIAFILSLFGKRK